MADSQPRPTRRIISANKARQGDIVLRTPLRRAVFIAGLAGAVVLAIVLGVLAYG